MQHVNLPASPCRPSGKDNYNFGTEYRTLAGGEGAPLDCAKRYLGTRILSDPVLMETVARGELLPDKDNRLSKFFTTNRSYFDIYGEMVLSELPMDWI